ncbi:microfibril-associated glycoprotein 4-like [Halichoeres trimaculatus]|uniref:microfibril-associated glycoprotein 4-like n=1 Tax=Halichoeres trimaculatus TaxID=147232 RepID=UPI003D9E8CB5
MEHRPPVHASLATTTGPWQSSTSSQSAPNKHKQLARTQRAQTPETIKSSSPHSLNLASQVLHCPGSSPTSQTDPSACHGKEKCLNHMAYQQGYPREALRSTASPADSIRNLTMKLLLLFVLLAPQLISAQLLLPLDCSDIYNNDNARPSGVYTIYPIGATSAVQVFCDMDSLGGRWTVFQRRMDGSVNFYRPWDHYKTGFGTAAGEYWLGLENLFHLTLRKNYELLVDMEDFEGNKVYARYSSFSIDPEANGYRLNVSGFIDGGAGDSLYFHNGQKFSTFDKDQDSSSAHCAKLYLGAFWYNNCHYANPNGVYRWGADGTIYAVGVDWRQWKGFDYSLKSISMKIRPVQ